MIHGTEQKNTSKQKTHKHFSDGPCGTIVLGTNAHPSQGQTGQNSDFTVEFNKERPVCPKDGSHFVPERGPICPRDGSCLSRRPSRWKCLCLLVFFWSASKGRQQMGETGFCKNLRFSAVSCENLRFPVFCANLRLPNPLIYRASRKSAKICKNLRKCAFRVRFLPFAVSLLARPDFFLPDLRHRAQGDGPKLASA